MSKNNENKLVPKLRFPEFQNDGEWKESLLNEVSPAIFDGTHQTPTYTENGIPFFSVENIISRNKNKFISREDYLLATTKNKPEKGDIIVTRIGNIGTSKVIDWDYEFSIYVTLAIVKKSPIFDSHYLSNYFQSSRYQKEILSKSLLNAVPCKINMDELRKTKILLPPDKEKKEQQKIATCLSSLDEVITAESQKLAILKDHKKGLLQNLLPQGGDASTGSAVPKFRFKEFEGSGEWVMKVLGEMTKKVGSGVTPLGGDANYKKTGRPFVRSQNVSWGIFLLDDIAFIDEVTHRNSINTEIEYEDVLLNITGASIGRSAVANEFVSGGNVNQHVCIIRVQKDVLNPFFLNQFLISDFGQKQIDSFQAGGNRQGLNFAQIRSFSIPIPSSLKEQQKIAETLSSIDELINAQIKKIEQLKEYKKGLLQGLFPDVTSSNSIGLERGLNSTPLIMANSPQ